PEVPAEVLVEEPVQGADSGVAGVTPTASISSSTPETPNGKVFIGTAQALQPDSDTHGSEFDLAQAVYAAADKVMNDKEWERPNSCYMPVAKPRRKSKGARTVLSNHTSDDAKPEGNSSRDSMASSRASSHFSDLDDVEHAISQLAPKTQIPPDDVTKSVEVKESPVLKNIIQGIDFFDTASDVGPELTGLLSADPNTLVFNVSLFDAEPAETQSLAEATADNTSNVNMSPATDSAVVVQPGWTMFTPEALQHTAVLRRSISMPGNTEHMYSPQPDVARSAVEPSEYKTVLVRKSRLGRIDAGRLGMSPGSMSSASRMGLRSGVLRNLGQRFTSWFKK
ncbi:hypothetical protein IW136_006485, partial [Coemansia sp. RSA 678]